MATSRAARNARLGLVAICYLAIAAISSAARAEETIGAANEPVRLPAAVAAGRPPASVAQTQLAQPSGAYDPDGVARRLAEAEAEIQALKQQVGQGDASRNVAASNSTILPPVETDWKEVQKRFKSWLDDSKKNTYPNVTVNGVFQADVGFFDQDPASIRAHGDIQDGADFRRARLSAKGAVTETVNYFFQMDFAFFGRPTFTDVWVEQTDIPVVGNVRFGQWKQPFSLEVVSSFRYTTFMERSVLFQPFTPFRHLGAGFYNHAENLNTTWAASTFRTGQDQYGDSISDKGGWGTCERLTHLMWYDEPSDGRYYLHTGVGHYFSRPPNDIFNFRTIPEFFIGENAPGVVGTSGQAVPGALNGTPFFVATGPLAINSYNVIGTELLWVQGPFSLQSEAMVTFVNRVENDPIVFEGFYAQAGYFLTGEHRPYDRVAGAIDRVKPFENFFMVRGQDCSRCTGWGAWEVATRLSYIDLNDQNVRGGTLTDWTVGVNWYWNPYTKMVFNYIHAYNIDPTVGKNDTDIFGMRMQVDF